MSDATARFALPFILPGQAQKELFHNEALAQIDVILHPAVEDGPSNLPPSSPEAGQCWLAGAAPEGDWEGHANDLAAWTEAGWRFASPVPGMSIWNKTSNCPLHWDGAGWTSALAAGSIEIEGMQVLGAQHPAIASPSGGTIIDAEARLAIGQVIATLMSHGLIE